MKDYESVDHPIHYGGRDDPYEAIKVIQAWCGKEGTMFFDFGNALKYICRAGKKPSQSMSSDLKKAVWYLQHALSLVDGEKDEKTETVSTEAKDEEADSTPAFYRILLALSELLNVKPDFLLHHIITADDTYRHQYGYHPDIADWTPKFYAGLKLAYDRAEYANKCRPDSEGADGAVSADEEGSSIGNDERRRDTQSSGNDVRLGSDDKVSSKRRENSNGNE